jgi:hypothetical protein
MILAELQPLSWSAVGGVLGVIVLILTVLEKSRKALGAAPEKREVKFADEFATRGEMAAVKKDVSRVSDDLHALKESIVSNGEIRRKNIEAKVESVRVELKQDIEKARKEMGDDAVGIRTTMDRLAIAVGEIRGKIDQALK